MRKVGVAALATGSFDISFSTSATPTGMTMTGHGTQDVNPLAIVAVSNVSMLGLGSATGYLSLTSQEITAADQVGTGVVDSVPVTLYRVAVDINQLQNLPGLTSDQVQTVRDAVHVLMQQGYVTTSDTLAVDGHGRILQSTTVTGFSDRGTVTQQTTFSNFGAPGRVQMPAR